MAPTDLPGEAELSARIGTLLDERRSFGVVATRVGDGADELLNGPACDVVLARLRAVVRGTDLLAFVGPCTFVLVSDELAAAGVPHVEERLRDAASRSQASHGAGDEVPVRGAGAAYDFEAMLAAELERQEVIQ